MLNGAANPYRLRRQPGLSPLGCESARKPFVGNILLIFSEVSLDACCVVLFCSLFLMRESLFGLTPGKRLDGSQFLYLLCRKCRPSLDAGREILLLGFERQIVWHVEERAGSCHEDSSAPSLLVALFTSSIDFSKSFFQNVAAVHYAERENLVCRQDVEDGIQLLRESCQVDVEGFHRQVYRQICVIFQAIEIGGYDNLEAGVLSRC